jgi:hypothetical protein
MEYLMSLISTIKSGVRSPPNQDRSGDAPTSPPTGPVETTPPRHLLVTLAGIDGLIDSIYERSADSAARPADVASAHGCALTASYLPAAAAVMSAVSTGDLDGRTSRAASDETSPGTGSSTQPSTDERSQAWASASASGHSSSSF